MEQNSDLLKGALAGLAAGFVASAVMNQFQKTVSPMITGEKRSHGAQSLQKGSPQMGIGKKLAEDGLDDPTDDAAERLANAMNVAATGEALDKGRKDTVGTVLHYGYGASMGAVYGMAAEVLPEIAVGKGAVYGGMIWAAADEGVVPLLGLSKAPVEYPLPVHISALAAHVVYGLVLEVVRRGVRKII